MRKTLYTAVLVSALSAAIATPAWSSSLMDSITSQASKSLGGDKSASQSSSSLGDMLGGGSGSALGLPSLSGDTAGNARQASCNTASRTNI